MEIQLTRSSTSSVRSRRFHAPAGAALFAALLLVAPSASADAPFQFSFAGLRAPRTDDVDGVRLSVLYGQNDSQRGLDLGFFSFSQSHDRSGAALIFGISRVTGDATRAVNLSLINFHDGTDSGFNGAFINVLGESTGAFNTGFVTVARGATSIDLGGLNVSQSSEAQIGFINVTKRIDRVQVGFLNMAENGILPVMPFFNIPRRMVD